MLAKTPHFVNIIIWRHAEAHPAEAYSDEANFIVDDMARALTPKGNKQAKRMAEWLNKCMPKDLLIITSPALRAYQTALTLKRELLVEETLKPSADVDDVIATLHLLSIQQPSETNLLIVGHQPWLWQLIAHLTGFSAVDINIKKGAVWWLRRSSEQALTDYNIIAVQSPSLLV